MKLCGSILKATMNSCGNAETGVGRNLSILRNGLSGSRAQYRSIPVQDALAVGEFDYPRAGHSGQAHRRRTLERMEEGQDLANSPDWVRQFFLLEIVGNAETIVSSHTKQ
jgi:hypothetical protein